MRTALLLLAGCHPAPHLDVRPWEAPVLVTEDQPPQACAPDREARVACVVDGDTVDLDTCGSGERVRLLAVDAPELAREGSPADCHAEAAAAELARLVEGRWVVLSFDRACADPYGRTLAWVGLPVDEAAQVLADGDLADVLALQRGEEDVLLVDLHLLAAGFARRFDAPGMAPLRWEAAAVAAERLAQARGAGLWSACR